MSQAMSLYEFILMVRQDVSQAQVHALCDHVKGVIEAGGGCVSKMEHWGLRTLAYPIKKNKKAHYVLMNIASPAAALDEVVRQVGLHEDVVRHLRLSVEKLDPNPSPLVQNKHYRERNEGEESSVGGAERRDAAVAQPAPAVA